VIALRRVSAGIAALLALLVVVVGVPLALWRSVGNPWPGWGRIELGDELSIVTGLLATIAWLVWARFVVAVFVEANLQIRMTLHDQDRPTEGPVAVAVPPPSRAGVGLLAQRLVAAALVLLPFFLRSAPAVATTPGELRLSGPVAALVVDAAPAGAAVAVPVPSSNGHRPAAPRPAAVEVVVVEPGDTLIGLARTHLGDGTRWREIFELNRDRVQPAGGRLTTPGVVLVGWTLQLPPTAGSTPPAPAPNAPAAAVSVVDVEQSPYVPAGAVKVEPGDTLWDLSHDRLETAGAPHDDSNVVVYLDDVIAANAAVVIDPDVIYAGQTVELPTIGAPPPAAPAAPPVAPAAEEQPAPPIVARAPVASPEAPAEDTAPAASTGVTDAVVGAARAATVEADAAAGEPVDGAAVAPTSTVVDPAAGRGGDEGAVGAASDVDAPSPIGFGEAALLSSGVLALLVARRRNRLRAARPRARVPEPPPTQVATERSLRAVDASERLVRVDVAVRAAAAELLDTGAQVAVVCVGPDGAVELTLTTEATMAPPWSGERGRWLLPATVPLERMSDAARSVSAPCVALIQVGVDAAGREVFVDLEALGLLAVDAPPAEADAVVRAMAATLGTSVFSEVADLVAVGLEPVAFLDHRRGHHVDDLDDAVGLAVKLVGTTATARTSTFELRARHTSGEAWEPAVVLGASSVTHRLTPELVRRAARRRGGLAVVVAGTVDGAPWTLRPDGDSWVLAPLGLRLTPVALSVGGLAQVAELLRAAEDPLLEDELVPTVTSLATPEAPSDFNAGEHDDGGDGDDDDDHTVVELTAVAAADRGQHATPFVEPPWTLLVRLLGRVEVVDHDERAVRFEKSKSSELVAWLALHRDRPTRAGARTALWELDVRDATFANVVSQARRAMARHVAPPDGEEWLGRTLTERLPLHPLVLTDAELVRARLDHARGQPPAHAIATLRPAVELIRDLPFAGTGYLWPDPEGIASNLVLLATGASSELAEQFLAAGDVDGVFWATGQGLRVLPGHEELIALRMRAHACAGDLSGVRLEWESYERVLDSDPWGAGEPAQKLVLLRRELLAS